MSRLLTKLPRPARRRAAVDDVPHTVVLDGISWPLYERLLGEIGNRPVRLTYDEGRLEIMSPLSEHESAKKFVGRLLEMLTFVAGIEVTSLGSTTFRRADRRKGLEPDECYFLKHAKDVRGIKRWNAKKHPPPDLVIEVDITSRSIDREPIYAAIGVPEIWRWDGARLQCLHLQFDHYVIRKMSLALPFLEPGDLKRFIARAQTRGENAALTDFVNWVKRNGWAQ